MQFTSFLCSAAAVVVCTSAAVGGPILGGTPLYTQDDVFAADAWSVTVSSYVYDDSDPPPLGIALSSDELLFVYLLDGNDQASTSINHFSVGNPNDAAISLVGWSDAIVPGGFDALDFQSPTEFGYSDSSQSSVWTFFSQQDPLATLEPTEWSLLFYVAQATDFRFGSATMSGAGIGVNHLLPVAAVPGPAALALIGAGVLFGSRRRRGCE